MRGDISERSRGEYLRQSAKRLERPRSIARGKCQERKLEYQDEKSGFIDMWRGEQGSTDLRQLSTGKTIAVRPGPK